MTRQRGLVLLLTMVLSLLLGLFATSGLRDALLQATIAGNALAAARALEDAEATLLEGVAQLQLAPPQACSSCGPPKVAGSAKGEWQQGGRGFFQLQNLGESTHVRFVPEGVRVTVYRVTAVSRPTRARQVLEAIYAIRPDQPHDPLRILWRQRSSES